MVAETDDYVAIASEFRSLAQLPDVKHATRLRARSPRRCTYGESDQRAHRRAGGRAEPQQELRPRARQSARDLNHFLHRELAASGVRQITVSNPDGAHNIAVGVDAPVDIDVAGHAGYYAAGMNKQARVTVRRQRRSPASPRT